MKNKYLTLKKDIKKLVDRSSKFTKNHPYFVGVQYHPELKSTVENPHPLFVSFVKAAMHHKG